MTSEIPLLALVALCALASAATGGARERLGALIGAMAAGAVLVLPPSRESAGLLLAADLMLVLLLGRLSWKSPRIWPVWVMGALGVGAAASLAFLLQADVDAETYARAMLLTRYAAAAALLAGLVKRRASHL